ncbi:MAG: TraR/DksA C4-type zinc finger protein [Dethiobacteria bacterium]|jgi:YteA family regulatory protein|nr:hypothetical protein [Bacillota bacterium]
MKRTELDYFVSVLNNKKQKLKREKETAEGLEKRKSLRDSTAELSPVDNHPADLGSENYERSKDISLHEKNKRLLQSIDDALLRIADGTYGICRRCGEEIPRERLEAVPETEFCRPCRELEEGVSKDFKRPLEEKVLETPYTSTLTDDEDSVAYDKEDAWNDVARHNKRPRIFEDELEDEEYGKVERLEGISNKEYKKQLPD